MGADSKGDPAYRGESSRFCASYYCVPKYGGAYVQAMPKLKAMRRFEKFLTVAGLVAVFYLWPPSGFWDGVWLFIKAYVTLMGLALVYGFIVAFVRVLAKFDFWVPIFADITWPLFRFWYRTEIMIVPADQFIVIGDSLFYKGQPVYSDVQFNSWLYVLQRQGALQMKREKGIYRVIFGKSI